MLAGSGGLVIWPPQRPRRTSLILWRIPDTTGARSPPRTAPLSPPEPGPAAACTSRSASRSPKLWPPSRTRAPPRPGRALWDFDGAGAQILPTGRTARLVEEGGVLVAAGETPVDDDVLFALIDAGRK